MFRAHAERDGLATLKTLTVDIRNQPFAAVRQRDGHLARIDRIDDRIDEIHSRRADETRHKARFRMVIQLERRAGLRDAAEALSINT